MTVEEKYKIIDNNFADLFIIYNRNEKLLNRFPEATIQLIDPRYTMAYVSADIIKNNFISSYGYNPLPKCYGLTSEVSLNASNINKFRIIPGFDLQGEGVLTAIIDTGIDYTNPIFRHEGGTSKIVALWDQTIDSENQYPEGTYYGTEYNAEQINRALSSNNPLDMIQSVDDIGHGTMLAGIMVGSKVPDKDFTGVAPKADIIVVKLKQAKRNIREFYGIPFDVPCYQENDILWGVNYVINTAKMLNRPCSICIGLGSSQGSHDGKGPLNNILNLYSRFPGITVSLSVGNEGNTNRHFSSTIEPPVTFSTFELNVGENENGFSMELWGAGPTTYSIDILSPSGEYISRINESLHTNLEVRFIFDLTIISVDYLLAENLTSNQLIFLRFRNPVPGIWKFNVYNRRDIPGSFHVWLPMNGFISMNTNFINPDSYTTILSPSDSFSPIALTAYNPYNDALFTQASRGYSRNGYIKPELAAPGVDVVVPTLNSEFTTASGTGLAAAHVAGITAIMLEWGVVRGIYSEMNTIVAKKYLIRGAKRSNILSYPNQDWGFGIIDLYNIFNVLRTDFPR